MEHIGIIARGMFSVDLPYVILALALVGTVGFWVVDRIMTRGIDLTHALFTDDNPVAGLEFGGIIFILLFLGFAAIVGPSTGSATSDMLAATGAIVVSLLLFAVMRSVLSGFVKSHNGGHDLNDEIFRQRNPAAALVSLSLMMCVANGITEENVLGIAPWRDFAIALTVLVLGLHSVILYRFTHLSGQNFMKVMFTDDNSAAGLSLFGFVLSSNIILYAVAKMVRTYALPTPQTLGLLCAVAAMVILALVVVRWVMLKLFQVRFVSLSYEVNHPTQKNLGAGFIDCLATLGITFILVGGLI